MRKILTVGLLCAAFGFVLGRSSVTRARAPEPELAVGAEIVVARPAREVQSKDGTSQPVYESHRLRVFGWRGPETRLTVPPSERPAWRITVAGREYVAAPVD